jgi:hypothetical protein
VRQVCPVLINSFQYKVVLAIKNTWDEQMTQPTQLPLGSNRKDLGLESYPGLSRQSNSNDVLWDLLEDAELDAKQRQLIWPDAERLDRHEIEEVLLNWIDMGYDQEHYSQAQLNELDSLTERWVADHLQNANASKTRKRTRHS